MKKSFAELIICKALFVFSVTVLLNNKICARFLNLVWLIFKNIRYIAFKHFAYSI